MGKRFFMEFPQQNSFLMKKKLLVCNFAELWFITTLHYFFSDVKCIISKYIFWLPTVVSNKLGHYKCNEMALLFSRKRNGILLNKSYKCATIYNVPMFQCNLGWRQRNLPCSNATLCFFFLSIFFFKRVEINQCFYCSEYKTKNECHF